MKKITLNEAEKVVGGKKWEITCRKPRVVGEWTIVRESKSMNSKKATDLCGAGNYSSWYQEVK
ncbi:hypothetical protein [Vibrio parahaemolyticus]